MRQNRATWLNRLCRCAFAALLIINCGLLVTYDHYYLSQTLLQTHIKIQEVISDVTGVSNASKVTATTAQQNQLAKTTTTQKQIVIKNWNLQYPPVVRQMQQRAQVSQAKVPLNDKFLRNFSAVVVTHFCDKNVTLFDKSFLQFRNFQINTALISGNAGGEQLSQVMNQSESKEFFKLNPGAFKVQCLGDPPKLNTVFHPKNTLLQYVAALQFNTNISSTTADKSLVSTSTIVKRALEPVTLALSRFEYVNLCHSMTYFYNAFLMAHFFKIAPKNLSILLIDAHPAGNLDDVWPTLFGKVTRLGNLLDNSTIVYDNLIWMPQGYDSPLLEHRTPISPPLLEDFRKFFLKGYNVNTEKKLNCSNINITFVVRRDYVSHPRNPMGKILRKIENEKEVLDAIRGHRNFSNRTNLQVVQWELLSLYEQLKIVANTDLLVGMHGAGLAHILMLPPHAALFELYPRFFPISSRFSAMAKWRNMFYINLRNDRADIKPQQKAKELESSNMSPKAIVDKMDAAIRKLCP